MANTIGWGQAAVNNTIDWGKGKTNNAIGWGSIYSSSPSGETDISGTPAGDADANAFIAAAAITDTTQKAAIDKLVVDLKGYGIWTKMKAIYPFIGGTAAQHKFNLRSPLDTDAAFRLVFNGGWVHSNTGALPNGTNAYADTKLSPLNNSLTTANTNISYYARTISTVTDGAEMGNYNVVNGIAGGLVIQGKSGTSSNRYFYTLSSAAARSVTNSPIGLVSGNSISTAKRDVYFNGASVANNTIVDEWTPLIENVYIGAANFLNSAVSYSNVQFAFSSIGNGLTDTESANYYTAVQAFQTTLGRNV